MQINKLTPELVEICAEQFKAACGYPKWDGYFQKQLERQEAGEIIFWVAHEGGEYRGHVRLLWKSDYPHFREAGIPEINDLNVAKAQRRQGIGTRLIRKCEKSAGTPQIGIGVGLYPGYNNAQRLYSKLGYVLDGNGVHYDNKPVQYGEQPPFDDSLVISFIKDLDC